MPKKSKRKKKTFVYIEKHNNHSTLSLLFANVFFVPSSGGIWKVGQKKRSLPTAPFCAFVLLLL